MCFLCDCLYSPGNMEASVFEDTCREMFGVHAYTSITMDRLVQNLVRQVIMLCNLHCILFA